MSGSGMYTRALRGSASCCGSASRAAVRVSPRGLSPPQREAAQRRDCAAPGDEDDQTIAGHSVAGYVFFLWRQVYIYNPVRKLFGRPEMTHDVEGKMFPRRYGLASSSAVR
jgi:hypothetical protein